MSFDWLILLFATGFGLGWLPWAPGTFGSLLGLPIAWWLHRYACSQQLLATVCLLGIALFICQLAAPLLGGGDPSSIVADEYLIFPMVTLGFAMRRHPALLVVAFALFRFFDGLKPWPIGPIETIGQGMGIVLDDVMAALYAWVVLALLRRLWLRFKAKTPEGY